MPSQAASDEPAPWDTPSWARVMEDRDRAGCPGGSAYPWARRSTSFSPELLGCFRFCLAQQEASSTGKQILNHPHMSALISDPVEDPLSYLTHLKVRWCAGVGGGVSGAVGWLVGEVCFREGEV